MRNLPFALMLAVATPVVGQPLVSPEVHADSRVTFRLRAPNAKDVRVRLETVGSRTMKKDEQGVWSFTSDPLEPDLYSYSFTVDGLQTLDPANPLLKYNLLNTENQVHVPGPATLAWEINDVPHGVVHRHLYRSAILGDDRPFLVYTPPGYDPAAAKTYPVLYLLHGYSDAEDAWVSVGRANVILDNLIAWSGAKPMLIVMPLGYGNKEVIAGGWAGLQNKEVWQDSIAKFRDVLLTEIIPQVEKAYRVSTDRESRAIAGLSMGGTQSLFVGLNALDRFAWIGAFSSGGLDEDFERAYPAVNENINAQLRLLWIACGQQDGLIGLNRKLIEWLKSKGVTFTSVEGPGSHSFMLWRSYLAEFLPSLFRAAAGPSEINGSHLALMTEPLSSGREPSDFAYRFLWIRTFHHPIAVRIERSGPSTILHAIELDGAGGYAWGRVSKEVNRELSPAEAKAVVARLDKARFWQMESEPRGAAGLDGATWVLEGSQNGKGYRVLRWCPEPGAFREVCLFFVQLASLKIPTDEIY